MRELPLDPPLPAPLVPAEVDLSDFPRMPFYVSRLRRSKSWLLAKKQPELGFYMMNLWMASWHETPPGSLEDDEDVLMDFAMCKERRWPEVREVVLRNWVKCSDGRLYHPTVAEVVAFAWESKLTQRSRTLKATAASKAKRDALRDGSERGDDAPPNGDRDEVRDGHATATKGKGEGDRSEGEEKGRDSSSGAIAPAGEPAPAHAILTAEQAAALTKAELWSVGKSMLAAQGMPEKQCGSFVGKLVKDYTDSIVIDAVRTAAVERPADVAEFLVGVCKRAGRRPKGVLADDERARINEAANAELERSMSGAASSGEVIDAAP